jgi:hypothetical protein
MIMNERMMGAADRLVVGAHVPHGDVAGIRTAFMVERWDADQTAWVGRKVRDGGTAFARVRQLTPAVFRGFGVQPYSVTVDEDCNMILQAGWVALLGGIAGTSITTKYGATVGRIGVGDSVTAAAYAQTDLQAATNKYYQLVSGAPAIATGAAPATLTFSAVFGTGNANYAWQEFVTDEGTASNAGPVVAVCLNRGVSAQGTKASGQTWTATETISFGYPSGSGTVS